MQAEPVTLVGKGQAKVGGKFFYMGDQNVCEPCKLKNICFNLEEGGLYEITQIRDAQHECFLNEGQVVAVKVRRVPFEAGIPKKVSIAGSVITFEHPVCDMIGCGNWFLCNPPNLNDGDKVSVDSVSGTLECPAGEARTRVELK